MGAVYLFVRGIDNICQYVRDESVNERVFTSARNHAEALERTAGSHSLAAAAHRDR
jgi:hypothetical protein